MTTTKDRAEIGAPGDANTNYSGADPSYGLKISDLVLQRRGLTLVSDLNLTLKSGSILVVTGPSGTGKTTLLRAIAKTTSVTSGKIEYPSQKLAFVFQEPRLLPWYDARTNVSLVTPNSPGDQIDTANWLERVGLGDAMDLLPHEMSGGMRQRVAIARALIIKPSLLLVDEPFSALDKPLATALRNDLVDLIRQQGVTTVWVTHNTDEVEEISQLHLHLSGPPGSWKLTP